MKKMKLLCCLVSIAMLSATVISACGNGETNSTSATEKATAQSTQNSTATKSDKQKATEKSTQKSTQNGTEKATAKAAEKPTQTPTEAPEKENALSVDVVGKWKATYFYDSDGNQVSGTAIYGSSFRLYGGYIRFNSDRGFEYSMGVSNGDTSNNGSSVRYGTGKYSGSDDVVTLNFNNGNELNCSLIQDDERTALIAYVSVAYDTYTAYFIKVDDDTNVVPDEEDNETSVVYQHLQSIIQDDEVIGYTVCKTYNDSSYKLIVEVDSEEDGHYYGFYRVEEDGATRLGKYTATNVVLYINDDSNLSAIKNDNGTYYSGKVSATDSGISMTWVPEDDDILSNISDQILTFTDKYDLSLISAFA